MKTTEKTTVAIFEEKQIRRVFIENEWWFSVVDIVEVLTGSTIPKRYWSDLKNKMKEEGCQVYEKIVQLKFLSSDGKRYASDAANTETVFRIIQSIPSPKAEPFKRWLAKVGYDRVKEIEDPELSTKRTYELYRSKGYSDAWIEKRMRGIAILTAEISKAAFGMTPVEYKGLKKLEHPGVNLRDHMTGLELIFTMLAEASTAEIERARDPQTMPEHKNVSREGGSVAREARVNLEKKSGRKVVTGENYLQVPEKQKKLS